MREVMSLVEEKDVKQLHLCLKKPCLTKWRNKYWRPAWLLVKMNWARFLRNPTLIYIFENWWYWLFQYGDIPNNNHPPGIKLEAHMIQAVCGYTAYWIDSRIDDELWACGNRILRFLRERITSTTVYDKATKELVVDTLSIIVNSEAIIGSFFVNKQKLEKLTTKVNTYHTRIALALDDLVKLSKKRRSCDRVTDSIG